MLFSASDDGTIKLWDLTLRTCVRTMTGHVGQVQSMKLLPASECSDDDDISDGGISEDGDEERARTPQPSAQALGPLYHSSNRPLPTVTNAGGPSAPLPTSMNRKKPMLISGSLDNTIKLWDVETGQSLRTFFGHIEGVWAVASDKLRLVSGSHDRTIKVC